MVMIVGVEKTVSFESITSKIAKSHQCSYSLYLLIYILLLGIELRGITC